MTAKELIFAIKNHSKKFPQDVEFLGHFFKTGKGQYGEGDIFVGVRVPALRAICKDFKDMSLNEIEQALQSPIHEVRLAAAIIMANQAKRATPKHQKELFDLYIRRTDRINNWDIVDSSCGQVVGSYLADKPRDILYDLARSKNLWERRIAIVSTWWFIRAGQLSDTYKIAHVLLGDAHDLIHKAVGWMLREAGKRDATTLRQFLNKNASKMPRTMLRYAIEKFDVDERARFLRLRN